MKKVDQHFRKKFPPVKLYLDDLTEIVTILEEEFEKIEILTKTHQYEKNEISNIPTENNISEIKAFRPSYISISFDGLLENCPVIYSETDSVTTTGIAEKIGVIFKKRERSFFYVISRYKFNFLLFALFIILSQVLYYEKIINLRAAITIGMSAFIFYTFMTFFLEKFFKNNIFIYKKKSDQPSFWLRKKDDIALLAIGALIGGTTTFLLTKIN